jgi:hypothetical protein
MKQFDIVLYYYGRRIRVIVGAAARHRDEKLGKRVSRKLVFSFCFLMNYVFFK